MMEVKRRPIPGYFRRDKSWDIVVTVEGRVLAIIELKSIVGNNPGQNFNNRTDEALGQALDVWTAVERGIIDSPLRPWLGYFMLIEDNEAWNRVSAPRARSGRPIQPSTVRALPIGRRSSSTVWSVNASSTPRAWYWRIVRGTTFASPSTRCCFRNFVAALYGRCLQFRATTPDLAWEVVAVFPTTTGQLALTDGGLR